MDAPVALEKPDSVDKGDVVAWLDSIDEPKGVDDTPVWLSVLERSKRLVETVRLASVDKLSGVEMLVPPEKLDGVGLSAVGELETDCPDELAPGSLVEPARLEVNPVLVPPNDCEVASEPLVD